MSIAENIKALRTAHKLSQTDFGKIAGVTDKAVSTWENGEKIPRMGAIQKLADHFGISKSDIIEDKCNTPTTNFINTVILAPNEKQMLEYFRSFNEEGQEKILNEAYDMSQLDKYKTKAIYLAARSNDNTSEHEIINDGKRIIEKLKKIPPVTDKEDF